MWLTVHQRIYRRYKNEILRLLNESFSYDEVISEGLLDFYITNQNEDNVKHEVMVYTDTDNEIKAVCILDKIKDLNTIWIEFIAVKNKYRNKGIAKEIIKNINKSDYNIIVEVEKESYAYNFWKSMRFSQIEVNYIQPSLDADKNPVYNLMLMTNNSIDKTRLRLSIFYYFKYAIRVDEPDKNEHYLTVVNSLS